MNIIGFFSRALSGLRSLGYWTERALKVAGHVTSDGHLLLALKFIEDAAARLGDSTTRREWVVAQLMAKAHIPESVARLVVELAYQLYKDRIGNR